MEKIAILGTGYVGLVTGAGLADFGNHVTCVDLDENKIAKLKDGKIPFYEFSLGEVVQRNVDNERLVFTSDLAKAIKGARTIFIAVGTPPGKGGEADLSQVFGAARTIAETMTSYKLVVQKSTVPVGTGRNVHELIGKVLKERKKNVPYDVASNPEFLREGSAVEDFMRPDRVVIGTWSKKAEQILTEIYRPLYLNETPMVRTNVQTAELIKYASNAFLATKISFINEMSNICEAVGGDVKVVAKAMGQDRRIGPKFLHAGPGYGGSCFPKDTLALADFSKALGVPSAIVNATIAVNAPILGSLTVPASITLGQSANGSVILNSPAPAGGATIQLTKTPLGLVGDLLNALLGAVVIPSSVMVPEGQTQATFSINTSVIGGLLGALLPSSSNLQIDAVLQSAFASSADSKVMQCNK